MPKPTFVVVAALVVSLGCSGGRDDAPVGETAYSGVFANTAASLSGACALLVPAPGSQAPARVRCVAEGALVVVDLTGTGSTDGAGYGTYQLAGTGGGLTWDGWVTVANAPGGGREAGGELAVHDDVRWWPGRMEALDERAGVNLPYCGKYVRGFEEDDFALVLGTTGAAGMANDPTGGPGFLGAATRSGSTLTFTALSGGSVIATAQIAPGLASIDGVVTSPPATFSATPCSASVDHVCCGAGAASRCCFQAACPCP